MTLAIFLVVAAVLGLVIICGTTISRSLQVSSSAGDDLIQRIEPIDIDAFRNLTDPAEGNYLRHRLSAAEFRLVQRERLRAMAAYIRAIARNATVLVLIGQKALSDNDAATVEAARELIQNGLLVRRNALVTLLRIYIALAWPQSDPAADPILDGYRQLSGSAMLLGRLQNPGVPVRISSFR